jgi:hypothetical protein
LNNQALIIIPAKRAVLAPTLQRWSRGGRSASRVLAETMIEANNHGTAETAQHA